MTQNQLRLWSALNLVTLLTVLYVAVGLALVQLVLGGDRSEVPAEYRLPQLVVGAVAGLAVALGAGWFDRRYLPWTAGLVLAGAVTATLVAPYWLVPVALAVSAVLRARAGRGHDPVPSARRQRLTALVVTPLAIVLLGLPSAFVVVQARPTPLYEAMRSDPMATDELPGLELEYDHSKDATSPLGIDSPAEVERSWMITDGTGRPEKLADLADLARTSGWSRGPEPVFCGWQKTVDGQDLCLVIRPGVVEGEVVVEITEDIGF